MLIALRNFSWWIRLDLHIEKIATMGNFGEEEEKLVTIRKKAVNTIVDSGIVAAGKARCGSVNEFPHQKHEFPHHLARWPPPVFRLIR